MALEKDFLKKAKRDVKVPTEEVKAKIERDDPDDKGEIAELLTVPEKEPESEPEAPAPAKPAPVAEAKPEAAESTGAPEKPAPKVKPEKDEGGDKVPVHLMVSERKRADLAERTLEEATKRLKDAETRLAEASKPKPEAKKEPEDPEPDREKKPIEWQEWKTRDLDRRAAQLEARIASVDQRETSRSQREQEVAMRAEYTKTVDGLLEAAATGSIPDRVPHIPDMKERAQYCREMQAKLRRRNGQPVTEELLDLDTVMFFDSQIKMGKNPLQGLSELADDWNYTPKTADKPAATSKPAADRIKDQQARESASRTTATMPGAPPKASSDEAMTADKWLTMSPKERSQFKKEHKDFKLDSIMNDA